MALVEPERDGGAVADAVDEALLEPELLALCVALVVALSVLKPELECEPEDDELGDDDCAPVRVALLDAVSVDSADVVDVPLLVPLGDDEPEREGSADGEPLLVADRVAEAEPL